jgi:hypothetical protein
MPEKEGAEEKKTTKEVVNKKQKQILNQEDYIPEEGYDVARDEGRVSPTKDKKDATTAPRKPMSAKERKKSMQQAQQRSQIAVNNVVTALRKKYGKDAVMYTQKTSKAKSNEELDLTKVAESFNGNIVDIVEVQKIGDNYKDIIARMKSGQSISGTFNYNKNKPRVTQGRGGGSNRMTGDINDPTSRYDYDQLTGKQKEQYQQIKREVEASKNKKPKPTKKRNLFPKAGSKNTPEFKKVQAGIDAKSPTFRSSVTGKKLPVSRKNVKAEVQGGVKSPAGMVKKVTSSIPKQTQVVKKVASQLTKGGLKTAGNVGKTVGKKAAGALAAKTIGRAGAKFGAKRIYGVGSAIAGAEAIGRFATGDIVGGTLAGAEAITGLIPGLGTGVSAGLGAVGLARDLRRTKKAVEIARKLKPTKFKAMRGAIASTKQSNKFVKGLVKPQNRTSTAIGLAGAGTVGSNVGDRRRNRFRLPNIPAPSLTGGSAGFRTAG